MQPVMVHNVTVNAAVKGPCIYLEAVCKLLCLPDREIASNAWLEDQISIKIAYMKDLYAKLSPAAKHIATNFLNTGLPRTGEKYDFQKSWGSLN